MPGEFVDSNVLLYITSTDEKKAWRAGHVLACRPAVTIQVLNEVANVASRKFRRTWPEVESLLTEIAPMLDVYPLLEPMHRDALRLVQRYRLSWWDALLIAGALSIGCETLYSEDMHPGLVVDGQLTIVNPFG